MIVKRIVPNIASRDPAAARAFYVDVLGLSPVMDLGWIETLSSGQAAPAQLNILSEGGSGTPAPDLSIEVDDLDQAIERLSKAAIPLEYGPVVEPWGVRRLYVRDPAGRLLNIAQHLGPG